jgi:hypothetical protein
MAFVKQKADGSVSPLQGKDYRQITIDEAIDQEFDMEKISSYIVSRPVKAANPKTGDIVWIPSLNTHCAVRGSGSSYFSFLKPETLEIIEYSYSGGDYSLKKRGSSQPGNFLGAVQNIGTAQVPGYEQPWIQVHSWDRKGRVASLELNPQETKENLMVFKDGFFEAGFSFVSIMGNPSVVTLEKNGKEYIYPAFSVYFYMNKEEAKRYEEWLNAAQEDHSDILAQWLLRTYQIGETSLVKIDVEKLQALLESDYEPLEKEWITALQGLLSDPFHERLVMQGSSLTSTKFLSCSYKDPDSEGELRPLAYVPLEALSPATEKESEEQSVRNNKRRTGRRFYDQLRTTAESDERTISQLYNVILSREKLNDKRYKDLMKDPITFYEQYEKMMEEQVKELKKDKRVQKVELVGEKVVVETDHLFMRTFMKDGNDVTPTITEKPVKIGRYRITLRAGDLPLMEHISRIKGITGRHPHFIGNSICFGSYKSKALQLLQDEQFAEVVNLVLEIMENVNLSSVARDLSQFWDRAVDWGDGEAREEGQDEYTVRGDLIPGEISITSGLDSLRRFRAQMGISDQEYSL